MTTFLFDHHSPEERAAQKAVRFIQMTKNEAEEMASIAREARGLRASIADLMIRWPGARWVLRPVWQLAKWVEAEAEAVLREDGWK